LSALPNTQPSERLKSSWYDLVSEQLKTLVRKFGLEKESPQICRAYELICNESLGQHPGASASTLNHDGTPIQFSLAMGSGEMTSLQFLSEVGDPRLSDADRRELADGRVRALSELLHLRGDLDDVGDLIDRTAAVDAQELDPDHGGTLWIGASFAPRGRCGLKIYLNGKNGGEDERWARLDRFVAHFGSFEKQQGLRRLIDGKLSPLGMAISLSADESPTGRVYLSGYGNRVSYYEDLLQHFGDGQYADAFNQYTELMLGEDRAFPTQSAVFSIGIGQTSGRRTDAKIEFCGHCLFESDAQALNQYLRWLTLRRIDAWPYTDLLDVIAPGEISSAKVNTHIYLGLGWKDEQEYSTIYLKPHPPECESACDEL
jgi:hypothetical protein